MKIYRLGELLHDPGGLMLGASYTRVEGERELYLIEQGWASNDDEDACATFRHNLCATEPEKVICRDVHYLPIEQLAPIDAFAFGFPCNDFSVVGEKKGINGKFGPLYTYGVRVLNHFEPDWFIAENVSGLQSADDGRTFQKILEDLRAAGPGYKLTTHLYKFEDYGVPQTRHRIIIVGIKSSLGVDFRVPAPTYAGKYVTAHQAIERPPIPKNASNHELTKQSKTVVERLKHIKPGENAWNASIPAKLRLNVKTAKMSQIYRRLDPNKPAYTITGSGGGGTHTYHWKDPRALTNRERARLQTFPDDFVFQGLKESVRKQIGMAVPPLGAQVILEAVLKTIAGISYPSVEPKWKEESAGEQSVQLTLLDKRTHRYR